MPEKQPWYMGRKGGIDIETKTKYIAVETGLPEDTDYDRLRECVARLTDKPVVILVPNREVQRKFRILFPRAQVRLLLEVVPDALDG